jgi:hypothetical protein
MNKPRKTYPDTTTEAAEKAKAEGFSIVDANENQLFVDLDNQDGLNRFLSRIDELITRKIVIGYKLTNSKTPGHHHAYVDLVQPLSLPERIMFQCVLGSDLDHEYFSTIRYIENGNNGRVVFFEPPTKQEETPYRVNCSSCGPVYLSKEQYSDQLRMAYSKWVCTLCGQNASWDDAHYETYQEKFMSEECPF